MLSAVHGIASSKIAWVSGRPGLVKHQNEVCRRRCHRARLEIERGVATHDAAAWLRTQILVAP